LIYLCQKTLFGKDLSLDELSSTEKGFFHHSRFKSVLKNETQRNFHLNYTHNVGMISSILFFPNGGPGTNLPPTLLERLKSPHNTSTRNDFIDFFNQFFRVNI
jgi:hypothetical protein